MKIAGQFQRYCRVCGAHYSTCKWEEATETSDETTGEIIPGYHMVLEGCKCKDKLGIPMKVVYIAVERSFDPAWAALWGVDLSRLYLLEPETAEQVIDMGAMALSSYDCDLLILDSVAAMTPKGELNGSAEDQLVGAQARIMARCMRGWSPYLHSFGVTAKPTILSTNQIRHSIGPYAGLVMPGGKSFAHSQDVIVRLNPEKDGDIKLDNDLTVGQTVKFDILKNKLHPPKRAGQYSFYFMDDPSGEGKFKAGDVDNIYQIITAATWWGLVEMSKGEHYIIPGVPKKLHGKGQVNAYFKDHQEIIYELKHQIMVKERLAGDRVILLPPELRSDAVLIDDTDVVTESFEVKDLPSALPDDQEESDDDTTN
jgi:RecA/RadA recombinase